MGITRGCDKDRAHESGRRRYGVMGPRLIAREEELHIERKREGAFMTE